MSISKEIPITEYALLHSLNPSTVKKACQTGRIHTARKQGGKWMIPEDTVYPAAKKTDGGTYVAAYTAGTINKAGFAQDLLLSFSSGEELIDYLKKLPDELKWVFSEYADVALNSLQADQIPDWWHPGILESIVTDSWWRAHSPQLYAQRKRKGLPPSISSKSDFDASVSDWDRTMAMLDAYARDLVKESDLQAITDRLALVLPIFGTDILRVYDGVLPKVAGTGICHDEEQLRTAAIDAWWSYIQGRVYAGSELVDAKNIPGMNKYALKLTIPTWYAQMIRDGQMYPVVS